MSTSTPHLLRVLLVDDQQLIRFTVRALCKAIGLLDIVGEAENGQQAVELTNTLSPDLVLMDAQMPILDGLQAAHQIVQQHPHTSVIILSAHAEQDMVRQALKAGARGYIQKEELSTIRLTQAIRVVEAGGLFFDTRTGTGLLRSFYAD
jgi:DNA-binding NarL/FixJ family response regulator